MKRCFLLLATAFLTITCVAQDDDWELDEWSMDGLISDTRGFSISPHLNGAAIDIQGAENNATDGGGGGLGVQLGYGVSNLVTLIANLDGTNINPERGANYALGHFDLGVMFNFLKPDKSVRPFLSLSLSGRNATFRRGDLEAKATGPGITAGGGIRYFASPSVSIDGEIAVTGGKFNSIELANDTVGASTKIDLDATSARFKVGISWFVSR